MALPTPVIIATADGEVVEVNEAAASSLGGDPEEFIGIPLESVLQAPGSTEGCPVLEQEETRDDRVLALARAHLVVDDEPHAVVVSITDFPGVDVDHVVYLFDAPERGSSADDGRLDGSMVDDLTGVLNYRGLLQRFHSWPEPDQKERLIAVTMDLQRFRRINEALGRRAADEILSRLAHRLAYFTRRVEKDEPDVRRIEMARLASDEFLFLVSGPLDPKGTEALVRRFLHVIEAPVEVEGVSFNLEARVGFDCTSEGETDIHSLVDHAIAALGQARARVGEPIVRYQSSEAGSRALASKLEMEQNIREGLDRGEFHAYFQPRIDLQTGRIVAAEALMRWQRPDGEMISPSLFIPVAEQVNSILRIGRIALEGAVDLVHQSAQIGEPIPVSVNLSGRELASPDTLETFLAVTSTAGVDPSYIQIEITEAFTALHPTDLDAIIRTFSDEGFPIVLDDFGQGESSLARLQRLPIDILKLDREFVLEITESEQAFAVLRALHHLSSALQSSLVLEGVETQQQLDLIRGLSNCEIQGFVFSPAVPADEFLGLMRSQPWMVTS